MNRKAIEAHFELHGMRANQYAGLIAVENAHLQIYSWNDESEVVCTIVHAFGRGATARNDCWDLISYEKLLRFYEKHLQLLAA